jgi:hypothetical protein
MLRNYYQLPIILAAPQNLNQYLSNENRNYKDITFLSVYVELLVDIFFKIIKEQEAQWNLRILTKTENQSGKAL